LISKPVAVLARPASSPALHGRLSQSAKITRGTKGARGPFASWSRAAGPGGAGQAFANRLRAGSAPLGGRGRYGQAASLRSRSSDRFRRPAAYAPVTDDTDVAPALEVLRKEARGPVFHLELKRVSMEGSEVRRRQLSTRFRLERYRESTAGVASSIDHGNSAFSRDIEEVKTEVRALLDDFLEDWDTLQPVNEELEALAQEADALVETDVRITELLSRMSRKLDVFEQTLGSCRIR